MQYLGREVGTAGPGNCPYLGINSNPGEGVRVSQESEHPSPVTHMRHVHVAGQAVRKRQPEPIMAQHFDVSYVMQGRDHLAILRQGCDRHRGLMRRY
jgi:hypothetical protein